MDILGLLIGLFFTGIIVGGLARLALPGRDPIGLLRTILVGVAGSWLAGLLIVALDVPYGWSFPLAVGVATFLVYLMRRSAGGSLSEPAPRRGRAY